MKLAICVKEVLDARLPLRVVPQTGEILQAATGPITLINPADRAGLEVALQIRDSIPGSRAEAFSVCEAHQQAALCFALARGADAAERIAPHPRYAGPPHTALLLASRFHSDPFDLICCGDETLDNASAVVGPVLAELLDLPQVTGVSRLRECTSKTLLAERSLERGHRELVEMELPGLVTFKAEAAEPKYVSLRRIQQAQRNPIPARQVEVQFCEARLPKWPEGERRAPPRARVKRKFAPDANLPPAERVKLIMAGGMAAQQSNQVSSILEGDADYLSEQLFRFLKHHEFV